VKGSRLRKGNALTSSLWQFSAVVANLGVNTVSTTGNYHSVYCGDSRDQGEWNHMKRLKHQGRHCGYRDEASLEHLLASSSTAA